MIFENLQPYVSPVQAQTTGVEVKPLPAGMADQLGAALQENFSMPKGKLSGVQNFHRLGMREGRLSVTAVLCPLYHGDGFVTPESGLGIRDSRVGVKWDRLVEIGHTIRGVTDRHNVGINWNVTFANMGLIVKPGNSQDYEAAARYHSRLYEDALPQLVRDDEPVRYSTFSGFAESHPAVTGNYPTVILQDGVMDKPRESQLVPFAEKLVERRLVEFDDVFRTEGTQTFVKKRIRERMEDLTTFGGIGLAQDLVEQYLVFNNHLISTHPAEGLHICLERVNQLLTGINTFAQRSPLAVNPRVEIFAVNRT